MIITVGSSKSISLDHTIVDYHIFILFEKLNKIKVIKLIDLILELCGDSETRKIIICLFDNDLTIREILKEFKVPKTSGYRKIENLIICGLIF